MFKMGGYCWLGLLMLSLAPVWSQELMAGAAKKKITPTGRVFLAGYSANRPNTGGVHDDIWVRCVVIQSGTEKIALAVCDLLGLLRPDVQTIREMVQSLPKDRILIASTHVHSGPDTIGLWGPNPTTSGVDPQYMTFLRKTVAECIEEAARNLVPATVTFASTKDIKGISTNARVQAILDTELGVMQFKAKSDGKVIATLVNYACHPEVMNTDKLTADFPNWLYQTIEAKAGGVAIYAQGACGGMVTAAHENAGKESADNWAEAERMGTELANKALAILADQKAVAEASIEHQWKEVVVPLENERFKMAMQARVIPLQSALRDGKIVTETHVFRVGPAIFATMPGEVLPNIGFLLKRILKGEPKFLIGLCCDELGYILSEEDYGLELYAYETSMSVGSQIGEQMVEAIRASSGSLKIAEASRLETLLQAFIKRFRPDRAGTLKATYCFDVSGEGGGVWTLKIADGKATLEKGGQAGQADCTIQVPAGVLIDILTGKQTGVVAYESGQLTILGDLGLAQTLTYIFE